MKFGDYIRQKREKNGWTQPEAAARATIEQSYLSKLENGKSYPSEDIYGRLVKLYAIDADEMCRSVFSDELDRLKEITEIRATTLKHTKSKVVFVRSWLVAGLVLLMLGGALFASELFKSTQRKTTYIYSSAGVIQAGEPFTLFDFVQKTPAKIAKDNSEQLTPLSERLDYHFLELNNFHGQAFVRKIESGQRYYVFVDSSERDTRDRNHFILAIGIMLLIGGLGSFYVSSRWR